MVVASAMLKTLAGTVIFEFVLIKLLLSPATKVYAPVLLEVDIEEDVYGPLTEEDPRHEGRVADHLGVEPRILRPKLEPVPGDVQGDEQVDEEYEPKRAMKDPGQPTKAEVAEHNIDHTPYRS